MKGMMKPGNSAVWGRAARLGPAALLLVGFLLLLQSAAALPLTWNIQTVDNDGDVGRYSSLELDAADRPHITYRDATNNTLKYAAWNGTSWDVETVDNDGNVGWDNSLALDAAGNPRVSYFDDTNSALKYAAWNGANWEVETVDNDGHVGQYTSLALDVYGRPHISYRDATNNTLKYAAWDGSAWVITTVDNDGNVGAFPSLALDANGRPRITYFDDTNTALKYAAWDGTNWNVETVDNDADVGRYSSLALDATGRPRVSYRDHTNSDLKYAAWNSSSWDVETVDSAGELGWFTSLALDAIGRPRISYLDNANADLKYAAWNGASWDIETVDSDEGVGWYTSLALDAYGRPHISYRDATNNILKYAVGSPPMPDIYLSTKTAGETDDGLAFGPEDIVKWDGDEWLMWFDGSTVFPAPAKPKAAAKYNINAFWIEDVAAGSFVASFAQNRTAVPGVGPKVDGTDLVRYDGSAFSLWFDGSDVGLTQKTAEKIDALHVLDGGLSPVGGGCQAYLLVSTQGPGVVPNHSGGALKFSGEDVLGFCLTNSGEGTAGFWHMVLDGSAEGLTRNATDSLSASDTGRVIYLTTGKVVNIPGDGVVGGHSTVYAYNLDNEKFSGPHFQAAPNGLPQQVDGLHADGSLP